MITLKEVNIMLKKKKKMSLINNNIIFLISILLSFIAFKSVTCFNLENRLPIVKYGQSGSLFGYSVAEHITGIKGESDIMKWLLVGAPKGQNLQPNTTKSGALFKCPITDRTDDCEQVVTDGIEAIDSPILQPPSKSEIKDDQWLGVTVKSQGPGGMVFVCAHRYIRKHGPDIDASQYGQGLCYILTKNLTYEDTSEPCKGRSVARGHEDYGYCQAGTSGALLDDGTMILGAPGPFNWRGSLFVISIDGNFLKRDKGHYYGPHTETNSPVDKYSYLGMSVTGGRYYGSYMSYAAGAPRSLGHGEVVLFSKGEPSVTQMKVIQVLKGEQFASSFGYEMMTADINGDGFDDIIIAAPFYFSRHEGGIVYVYQNENYTLPDRPTLKLTGKLESRFGLALTNLGDINKDNCDDIAIGAPYEGNGVVYIYLGSKTGLIKQPSQIITASDLGMNPILNTFGCSLSGGNDLDDNNYPDLLIGAYDSSAIVALLARPIISIITKVNSTDIFNIDPKKVGCLDQSNSNLTCFSFDACCSIDPYELATNNKRLELLYKVEAETYGNLKKFSRVFFDDDFNKRVNIIQKPITVIANGEFDCRRVIVYIKENTRDIQTPIKFRLNYSIVEPVLPKSGLNSLHPILDKTQADRTFEATFQKDCGSDDICESQLKVEAELELDQDNQDDAYTLKLGNSSDIRLTIIVTNWEESAYEAQVFVQHIKTMSYIGALKSGVICDHFNKTMVSCSLGNPMPRGAIRSVTLRFDPSGLDETNPRFEFIVFANSTSKQLVPQNNTVLEVTVVKEAQLSINGRPKPQQSFYGGELKEEKNIQFFEQVGTMLQHTYQIYNDGPWRAPEIVIDINWPHKYLDEKTGTTKWLLYLVESPSINSSAASECFLPASEINPLKLTKFPIVSDLLPQPYESRTASNKSYTYSSEYSKNSSYSKYSSSSNRLKRDIIVDVNRPENLTEVRKHEIIHLDCNKKNVICLHFQCKLFNLPRKLEAFIEIRGVLWNSTLVSHFPKVDHVKIASNVHISIPLPYGIQTNVTDDYKSVETHAYPELSDTAGDTSIALWIYIVAILGGLLVLALVSFCLYKMGFFKRRRPDPTLSGNLEKSSESKPFIS